MDTFIARQPIFDRLLEVQAYELLFRSGLDNVFLSSNMEQASSKVIADSLLLPRLDAVSGGKMAFVNVTRDVLLRSWITLLPPASTTVEILETIRPDRETIHACGQLKGLGYQIALDDFQYSPEYEPLIDLADIVKVDVLISDLGECAALAKRLRNRGVTLLAEKVETIDAFKKLSDLGYELFQGYFFARPVILRGRDISTSQISCLQVIQEIHRPDLDISEIGAIIEREVGLTYKLLRYINSAFFGWQGSVDSVRHALLLLGQHNIKRWATVVAMASMAADQPDELITMGLLRARFCEQLGGVAGMSTHGSNLFFVGLFSVLEAILGIPIDEILNGLPIDADAKAALLGEPCASRSVLDLVTAYTQGDWPIVETCAAELGVSEQELPVQYESALAWCGASHSITRASKAA